LLSINRREPEMPSTAPRLPRRHLLARGAFGLVTPGAAFV